MWTRYSACHVAGSLEHVSTQRAPLLPDSDNGMGVQGACIDSGKAHVTECLAWSLADLPPRVRRWAMWHTEHTTLPSTTTAARLCGHGRTRKRVVSARARRDHVGAWQHVDRCGRCLALGLR